MRLLLKLLATPCVLLAVAWAGGAVWFDGPASRPLAAGLSLGYGLGSLALLPLVRPYRRALGMVAVAFVAVLAWWFSLAPRNDRPWLADVAYSPKVEIDGSRMTVRNLRNFDYRSETDYDPRWEERTYDLDQLRGVDVFLSYWGSPYIAHPISSWDFGDGRHLAISIETRKEVGESYSAVRGFFRQYELYYVLADERDVVRLRTNYRGEEVHLYRVQMSVDHARAVLLDYLEEVNDLARAPRWYNALTHNCTTEIRDHVTRVIGASPWDWRLLLNGYVDQLWYERGAFGQSIPFADLRQRSNIVERAKAADQAADFSTRIREGLP